MKLLFFGPVAPPISGPGVKNEMMIEWVRKNVEDLELFILNTHDLRKLNLISIKQLFSIFRTKHVLLSVSKNGRFLFIPLFWLLRKKVFLFPAGGSFDDEILDLPSGVRQVFIFFCRSLKATFPQSKSLAEGLVRLGFQNVVYFPNPRINRYFSSSVEFYEAPFKIIFLSKIREGKGPLLLLEAVRRLLLENPEIEIEVNFYGLIDPLFSSQFITAVEQTDFANYRGEVSPSDVQSVISKHHLFVLPTLFAEGIPGAIIEAMLTGIPIIVSSFRASNEMVTDFKDGLIVPQGNVEALKSAIYKIITDRDLRISLSQEAKISSAKYDMDLLMENMIRIIKRI